MPDFYLLPVHMTLYRKLTAVLAICGAGRNKGGRKSFSSHFWNFKKLPKAVLAMKKRPFFGRTYVHKPNRSHFRFQNP
jgi:hypothetical protein